MPHPLCIVDAFTQEPFKGNPAAVCLLQSPQSTDWQQQVAMEMNHAETAFLVPQQPGRYGLRWFTPAVEVDLCGHATLASAHALWTEWGVGESQLTFDTRSGDLTAIRFDGGIQLDFPATLSEPSSAPHGMMEGLGLPANLPIFKCRWDYLVHLDDPWTLRTLKPDSFALRQTECRGIIVTSRSDDPAYDFLSRFFAPGSGIDEDPVTGSAHCALAPYWAQRLGKECMTGYQASKRGGAVKVRLKGDRVELSGSAVTTLVGSLRV